MTAIEDAVLEVTDLCARVNKTFRLEDISLAVAPGERVALLGPNGSGKSTFLRILLGLAAPRAGRIASGGRMLSQDGRILVSPAARGFGILFQECVLFPHLNVRENVALGVPAGTPEKQARARVLDALATMRAEHLQDRAVDTLSGGEQQRVALARAVAQEPRMLLLDEPFHSLDCVVRSAVMADLRSIAESRRIAVLWATHDLSEVAAFAERAIILRDGRKIQDGTLAALRRAPADDWAASFLGSIERPSGSEARSSR